ncbi:aminoglycoside phosphotransferase family protein [Sporichthya sp.]|uniref:aminoglycoside phosphotransferase family protein n=1 Tax=Sporichthya sp. TaxID=65475 RepID=UPI00185329DA|nr:aminoglycoside phosphotransferase family protein [Sporichthya sp.]MBA3743057.1 phosphotransferase [Sporichthya sp.]
MLEIPEALRPDGRAGPWNDWLAVLPARTAELLDEWSLTADGPPIAGRLSLVVPVRSADGRPNVLKVGYPHDEAAQEHLALRYWGGNGAVELLRADPRRFALLLERAGPENLTERWDLEACEIVGGLYGRIHVPAPPQLPSLAAALQRWTEQLRHAPAALPPRLVEQAIALGTDLASDPGCTGTLIHTDLHYENVLASERETWLVIDPKPLSGDPHYELAPMLTNRWDEVAGQVRAATRRRFDTLVDVAGFDEGRARAWVIVRVMHSAVWAVEDGGAGGADAQEWLTRCVAVAKAVQG